MIQTFREWKGEEYVPNNVHSAIRWSKRDPLLVSEIIDVKPISSPVHPENKKKRKADENVPKTGKVVVKNNQSLLKKPCLSQTQTSEDRSNHYLIPHGMTWSNNSCAYDSIFTVLFSIWCQNKNLWNYNFEKIDNIFIKALSDGFNDVDNNIKTLEGIRDHVRQLLHSYFPQTMAFGHFTSIESVFSALLDTTYPVQEVVYICCNNHVRRISDSYSLVLLSGVSSYESTNEWIQRREEETQHLCTTCEEDVFVKYSFTEMPSLIVFEFGGQELHMDFFIDVQPNSNGQSKMRLAGIIYYGRQHFTAQIILSDGQIWFYDGITTGKNLVYSGSIYQNPPDLSHCRGKQASAAIYVCV